MTRVLPLARFEDGLRQRVAQAVGVLPLGAADLGHELVMPLAAQRPGLAQRIHHELITLRGEIGVAVQLVPGQVPEPALRPHQIVVALFGVELEALVDLLVKVLQQIPARVGHAGADLSFQVIAEGSEGMVDLLACAAGLVNVGNAALEVHAGFQGAEHLVGRAEDPLEEIELLRE